MRPIFHLALPVADLDTTRRFYVDVLGARIGRDNDRWIDVLFYGHQITFHARPGELPPDGRHGVRHFGAILPWSTWESTAAELRARDVEFTLEPTVSHVGTEREQGKLMIVDPSGHRIELKAYRDPAAALQLDPRSGAAGADEADR